MSLDPQTLSLNAKRIAEAAHQMEQQTGVPKEFAAAQCCLESGWLERCPGNNPFGIKAHANTSTQLIQTKEFFTDSEAAAFKARGNRIELDLDRNGQPVIVNGKKRYTVWDKFAAYPSLEAAFLDYANLLKTGKYFQPSWIAFQEHQDRNRYISEMAKAYATDPEYASKVRQIIDGKRLSSAFAGINS